MVDHDQDELAQKIADEIIKRIYVELGKSFCRKMFWLIIAVTIALAVSFGIIKVPTAALPRP